MDISETQNTQPYGARNQPEGSEPQSLHSQGVHGQAGYSDLHTTALAARPTQFLDALISDVGRRLGVAERCTGEAVLNLRAGIFGTEEPTLIASFLHANPSVPSRQLVSEYRLHSIASSLSARAVNLRLDMLLPRNEHMSEGGGSTLDFGFVEIPLMDARRSYREQPVVFPENWRDIIEQRATRILPASQVQALLVRCEQIGLIVASAPDATAALASYLNLPFLPSTSHASLVQRISQNLEGVLELSGAAPSLTLARDFHQGSAPEKISLEDHSLADIRDGLLEGRLQSSNELLAAVVVATRTVHFGNMYEYKCAFPDFDFLFLPDNTDGAPVGTTRTSSKTKQRSLATRDLTLFSNEEYRQIVMNTALGRSTPFAIENHNFQLQQIFKRMRTHKKMEGLHD